MKACVALQSKQMVAFDDQNEFERRRPNFIYNIRIHPEEVSSVPLGYRSLHWLSSLFPLVATSPQRR